MREVAQGALAGAARAVEERHGGAAVEGEGKGGGDVPVLAAAGKEIVEPL